ncbi:MAG TPA: hypothetical protein VLG11_00990 [Candidatus Saccharimonadales bacterium]|nr:hypothetical protein [Candidatus Saccharimonadales bacterium]
MINAITYVFPANDSASEFYTRLRQLLGELPNAVSNSDGSLTLAASVPQNSLPITMFRQEAGLAFPYVQIGESNALGLRSGNLCINPNGKESISAPAEPLPKIKKQDALGAYYEVRTPSMTLCRLPIEELQKRLAGHVVRIDHTGLNLPSASLSKEDWQAYIHTLARQCNLYRYPSGEDWPFILPATAGEFDADITAFPAGREPKFELVYDTYSTVPTIQIDIETDLLRAEVEQLFPEPYGVSFPDLADYFRTVYVEHDWRGLSIRFDIRFKEDNPNNDWNTGKWLVHDGGRIRKDSK